MRRENNKCEDDKHVRNKETSELNRSILLSCPSHDGRIKNEHKEEPDCLEFCTSPECVPALDDSYERRQRDAYADKNQREWSCILH
jgi:hypothetical protein